VVLLRRNLKTGKGVVTAICLIVKQVHDPALFDRHDAPVALNASCKGQGRALQIEPSDHFTRLFAQTGFRGPTMMVLTYGYTGAYL
jgi:hypothetical protein